MTARRDGGVWSGGAVVIGLVLAAAWLWAGPGLADAATAGIPDAAIGEALFTTALFAPLLLLAVAGAWITGATALRFGTQPGRWSALGLVLGAGGLMLAVVYAGLAGGLTRGTGSGIGAALILGILAVAFQALSEEALFRGWFQPAIATLTGSPAAVAIVAIIFAAFHLFAGAQGALAMLSMALGGVLFGVLAWRGGGIAGAFTAHFGWNAAEQIVLGLDPNPGVGGFGALFDLELVGPALWGGSDAGLNGSLAMTFALAAILAPLLIVTRRPAFQG